VSLTEEQYNSLLATIPEANQSAASMSVDAFNAAH